MDTFLPDRQTVFIMLTMTERIRLTFDVPDLCRRALNVAASGRGVTVGELIEELVLSNLSDAVEFARKEIESGYAPTKSKRGPKPKPRREN